jgi:hypothetical protein
MKMKLIGSVDFFCIEKVFIVNMSPEPILWSEPILRRAGTHIIGRNQYYSCLAFRPERLTAWNEYYATPAE